MKLSGLLTRRGPDLPGVRGVARVDRRTDALLRRVSAGDVAVLDQVDLDRATADALVAADVAGVVNVSPSISGRFPNLGPEIVVGAGVPLVDDVGSEVLRAVKDGAKIRLHDGVVYVGGKEVARGTEQTAESIADRMVEAKAGLSSQLEAFSANTIEFMRRERPLLLDGVGVPPVKVEFKDRHVLVVAAGYDHVGDLSRLRHYIREYRPVLVGVGAGADALRAAGHTPALIVGNPVAVAPETLRCGAQVVVPADPDGHASGLEQVEDSGISVVSFPASGNPEDLALLLADEHGAALVVTVGFQATLVEFLDRGRSGSNPSTFLTRLKVGGKLVDSKAVAALYRSRVSLGAVLLLITSALVAVAAVLLVSDAGNALLVVLAHVWRHVTTTVSGLFR